VGRKRGVWNFALVARSAFASTYFEDTSMRIRFIASALAALLLSACGSTPSTSTADKPAASASAPMVKKTGSVQPDFAIPSLDGHPFSSFAFFYDQDRGETFFITSAEGRSLAQVSAENGSQLRATQGTSEQPIGKAVLVSERYGFIFVMDVEKNLLRILELEPVAKQISEIALSDISNPQQLLVGSKDANYLIAILAQTGAGPMELITIKAGMSRTPEGRVFKAEAPQRQNLGVARASLAHDFTSDGLLLSRGVEVVQLDLKGVIGASLVSFSEPVLHLDSMVCATGSNPGYWIAVQQKGSNHQVELIQRNEQKTSIGTVSLNGVKLIQQTHFSPRRTPKFLVGGLYAIADGKFVGFDWSKIADSLGARRVCF
jgi:hypothetical protein